METTKQQIIDHLIGCNLPEIDVRIISSMIEMLLIEQQFECRKEHMNELTKTIESL